MKGPFYVITLLFILFATTVQAQDGYAILNDSNYSTLIHADPRLAILIKKHKNVHLGVIRSGRGFRVQIYNGNDRVAANKIKMDFMRRFPGIRTYMTYVQPQFRVKVGDFRSRPEAHNLYEQVSTLYNPCMIVPDIIVINTLKENND